MPVITNPLLHGSIYRFERIRKCGWFTRLGLLAVSVVQRRDFTRFGGNSSSHSLIFTTGIIDDGDGTYLLVLYSVLK